MTSVFVTLATYILDKNNELMIKINYLDERKRLLGEI